MVHNIRLFASTTEDFSTNGLGTLAEAIKCEVTEEANGAFELELEYPVWGKRYNDLIARNFIVCKSNPFSTPQIFRIYSISRPMDGIVTFNAQHISYDLSCYPLLPFKASSCAGAITELNDGNHSLINHRFTFWTDKNNSGDFGFDVPVSIRSALGGTEGSILDVYGGDYEFDNFEVKLHNKRGVDRGFTVRYGKNLTDFSQEEGIDNVYTYVLPYWTGRDEDGSDIYVTLPEYLVKVDTPYQFTNVLILDTSSEFQDEPSYEEMREYVKAYITDNDIGTPSITFDISFFQLSQALEYKDRLLLDQIELFDTVTVEFDMMLGKTATAKVVKTVYDAITDRYESITLGTVQASISDTVGSVSQAIQSSEKRTNSHLEQAVQNATWWITNGKGYMVAVKDDAGNWKEICSLDKPSIELANHVWRWNNGGFGYSGTGYNGPYTTAITQDGHIVANFIDTGVLTATIIKSGVLAPTNGDCFYLDLDNGILRMNATELSITGKPVAESIEEAITAANQYTDTLGEELSKETKDALANAMTQESIFNALTNNKKLEGLFMKDGKLYVNGSYVYGGTIVSGGANNVSGIIEVRNASGKTLVTLDNRGIILDPSCKIAFTNISGTEGLAKKTDIPTKTSQLTNDSSYAAKEDLPTKLSQLVNDSGYAKAGEIPSDDEIVTLITNKRSTIITKEYIATLKVVAGSVTSGTVTSSTISGNTISGNTITGGTISGSTITVGGNNNTNGVIYVKNASGTTLITLDKNGITLSGGCTISWSNISGTPTIPTKTSQLTNDSNYAKTSQIPTKTSQLTNDSNYTKKTDLPTKLSQLTNDSGYAKSGDIPTDSEIVTLITNKRSTIITKDYIGTLKVVAGSVLSGSVTSCTISSSTISGNTISGGTISGTTITGSTFETSSGSYKTTMQSGQLQMSYGTSLIFYLWAGFTDAMYSRDPENDVGVAYLSSNQPILYGLNAIYLSAVHKRIQIGIEKTTVNIGTNTMKVSASTTFYSTVSFTTRPSGISLAQSYGPRIASVPYTTSSIISDIGSGMTDDSGECMVLIDDMLFEMTNTRVEYQVFLQKEGPGDIWVSEKNSTYFTVMGTPNLKFSWEVKLKTSGSETERLDPYVEEEEQYDQEPDLEYEYDQEQSAEAKFEADILKEIEEQQLFEEEELLNGI